MSCRPASRPLRPRAPRPSRPPSRPGPPLTASPFLEDQTRGRTVAVASSRRLLPLVASVAFHGLIAHFCLVLSSIPWSGWTTLYVSIRSPKDALVSIPVSQRRTLAQRGHGTRLCTHSRARAGAGRGGAAAWGGGTPGLPQPRCSSDAFAVGACRRCALGSSLLRRPPDAPHHTPPWVLFLVHALAPQHGPVPRGAGHCWGCPHLMGPPSSASSSLCWASTSPPSDQAPGCTDPAHRYAVATPRLRSP